MDARKIIVSVVTILVIGLTTYFLSDSIKGKPQKPKMKVTVVKSPLVNTLLVSNKELIPTIFTEGKLQSSSTITVSLEGKGTLQSAISLKNGTSFRKGQRIAYVVDQQSQANFKASLSKYHQILTNALIDISLEYPEASAVWEEFSNSVKNGDLPTLPSVSNDKLSNYLSAKGVFNTYYDLKSIQTSLGKRYFSAPFNGYVNTVYLQNGSFINGTSRICDISPSDKLEIEFSIDNRFSNSLKMGSKINVSTENNRSQHAKIIRVGQEINSISQQRTFVAQLLDKSHKFLAGDFIKISVPLTQKPVSSIVVPSYCVNGNVLYKIAEDSTLQLEKVEIIGVQNDSLLLKGLKDKQRILYESVTNFEEGQKVRFN